VDRAPLYRVMEAFQTPSLQWIQTNGDWTYMPPAMAAGYKVTNFYRELAGWNGRESPKPYISVCPNPAPPELQKVRQWQGMWLCQDPRNEYAYVDFGDGATAPCAASGTGGDLSVRCSTTRTGTLVVQENSWTGWLAWQDGISVGVTPASSSDYWLKVLAPAGEHTYSFRYRPWDVWMGLGVTLIGLILLVVLWVRADPKPVE
jgi:hypothetical protein